MIYNHVLLTLYIATSIFVIFEIFIPQLKRQALIKEIDFLMNKEKISFEEAKEKLNTKKMARIFKIDQDILVVDDKVIKQGDRVSFQANQQGFVTGEFLGLKELSSRVRNSHFFIKMPDNKIISGPVEMMFNETLLVYKR